MKQVFQRNNEHLPKNIYDAKSLVSKLGLEAKRIDGCGGRQRHTRYAKGGASIGDVRFSYESS